MSKELVNGRWGRFYAHTDDRYLGEALVQTGEYGEEEAQFLLGLCNPGDFCLEIGANAGYLTIPLASKYRVWAVEPQISAYELLCENILLNDLGNKVMPIHAACGDERGIIWMPDIGYEQAGNHGSLNASHKQFGKYQLKTPLITVDALIQERVHLIKIDVEGMEREVLLGAIETIALYQPLLYVENDRQQNSEALIKTIWDLGYDCIWHTPYLFNPDNFLKNPVNLWPEVASFNMICAPREQQRLEKPIINAKEFPA